MLSGFVDLDRLDDFFGFRPFKINVQKSIFRHRASHFHAISQNKTFLKLAPRDAAVQENPPLIHIALAPAHNQFVIFNRDRKILLPKPGHSQGDAVTALTNLLYIERRIAIAAIFCGLLNHPLQLLKPKQEGVGTQSHLRHRHVLEQATCVFSPIIGGCFPKNMGWGRAPCKGAAPERLATCGITVRLRAYQNNDSCEAMSKAEEMKPEDVLRVELEVFRREHGDLDEAIHALEESGRADQLRLRRLKKQKLALKDTITRIEDLLTPDIIA